MEKYIYKITNQLNNKCYIGQTTDYKRRFQEHKNIGYGIEENKLLYYAIKKYGIENFSFEVIEDKTSKYNEREKYWIQYYDSFENGYNMTEGGEEPPLNIGINSPFATHTEEEIEKIKQLLRDTKIQYKDIATMFNYDSSTIERINYGKLWRNDSETYPIRKESSREYQKERALNIINDLLYTNLTQKKIAEKYGCARTTVTAINRGVNYKQDDLDYPLRK